MAHFNWNLPYASQREGVLARNIVATSQPLAAQAGLEMMRMGGNAIDAAVATAITLTLVEPVVNGIGSDNFALVWAGGGLHGLNASGRAPAMMTRDKYARTINTRGWEGVTVPGCVSGWVELHKRFGALPFETLFAPAVLYARDGFIVSRQTGQSWRNSPRAYRDFQSFLDTFAPGGSAPGPGDLFRSEDHARTYEEIATTNGESFYSGALAKKIADHARETGGAIREEDLAAHRADWVRPIQVDYHGYALNEIPPNGQGLVALIALGILKFFRLDELEPDSVESQHVQIEAMKLAFADGHRYIADPDHMDVSVDQLLDAAYLESRANLIDRSRAQDFQHGTPKYGGTVYLCTADAEGNMVSLIQSNYTGFGSGIVIPGTGIAMQNRGCCFTLEEGHPNLLGPGKRPYHTIIPGFLTLPAQDSGSASGGGRGAEGEGLARDERPVMAFGVMGGFMQPQGHAQVTVRLVTYRQNPQAALDAPRFQVDRGLRVSLEPGFDEKVYEGLRELGHDLTIARSRSVTFGRGQAIHLLDDGFQDISRGYFAGSDQRADGQAVGF